MLVGGRIARAVVAACAVAALTGCTSDPPAPTPQPSGATLDVTVLRAALLEPKDVGETWKAPERSGAPVTLVSLCGGDPAVPPVPGRPAVTGSVLVDEGEAGAQSLEQVALAYDGPAAATAGLTALRAVAQACPGTVTKASEIRENKRLPGYTETVTTTPLNPRGWSGFVVVRHRAYEATSRPATGDTAVAVLSTRNVVLVVAYSIYRLGAQSTGPGFTADWQRLVGSVARRVGG
ncbi:MAG TPA: hypothetical protein VF755_03910 [Catenuloplanes sp.]|jgi:hypothetical protein